MQNPQFLQDTNSYLNTDFKMISLPRFWVNYMKNIYFPLKVYYIYIYVSIFENVSDS